MKPILSHKPDIASIPPDIYNRTLSSKRLILTVVAICALSAGMTQAHAQEDLQPISDPNQLCLNNVADIGPLSLPMTIEGELEADPIASRVDFYRFQADPGSAVVVQLRGAPSEVGTLRDPFLGLFNDQCQLLLLNDDFSGLESQLQFQVPGNGEFIIAAAKYPDAEFNGNNGPDDVGTYQILFEERPPVIGLISVRIIDQLTGAPLPGGPPTFAFVDLYRCVDGDCDQYEASLYTDSEGIAVFDNAVITSSSGLLGAGTYLLRARADNYGSNESGRFTVAANEAFEVWDIALAPPPLGIGVNSICDTLPVEGGICEYEIQFNNNTDQPIPALAWSIVEGYNYVTTISTEFEASTVDSSDEIVQRAPLMIDSFDSAIARFSFDVPSSLSDGAQFCQSIYLGLEPDPLYNVLAQQQLFCVEKIGSEFRTFQGARMSKAGMQRDERSIKQRSVRQGIKLK